MIKKQLISLALLLTILVPASSFAETSMSEKIAQLQSQIAELQAQLKVMQGTQDTGTTKKWCHDFNYNIGMGQNGAEMDALEYALGLEGFTGFEHSSNLAATYDERVASAVTGFQEKYKSEILTPNGLSFGTGYVGKATRAKLNKLYGCHNDEPTPTPAPKPMPKPIPMPVSTLNVLSPNGGESWLIGTIQWISWTYKQNARISGWLVSETEQKSYPIFVDINGVNLPPSDKYSAFWTVGRDTSGNNIPSGVYRVIVCEAIITSQVGAVAVCDTSDSYFKIYDSTPPPTTLTVISPNGGETWTIGTTQSVKWTSTAGAYSINLISEVPACTTAVPACLMPYVMPYSLAKNLTSTSENNTFAWGVGKSIDSNRSVPAGSYRVQVCRDSDNTCDTSDSYFKIVSPVQNTVSVVSNPELVSGVDIIAGSVNALIGAYTITNPGNPISISSQTFSLGSSATIDKTALVNVTIRNSSDVIVAGPANFDLTTGKLVFNDTLTYPSGTSQYKVYASIGANAGMGKKLYLTTTPAADWTAKDSVTGASANFAPSYFSTNELVTIISGMLNFSINANSPTPQTVPTGSSQVNAFTLDLNATYEPIVLKSLGLQVGGTNPYAVSDISIWDSSTLVGKGTVIPGNPKVTITLSTPVMVSGGLRKSLTIKVDFLPVGSEIKNGDTFKLGWDPAGNNLAIGQQSGAIVNISGLAFFGNLITLTAPVAVTPSVNLMANGGDGPLEIRQGRSVAISWILSSNFANGNCTKSGAWQYGTVSPMNGYKIEGPLNKIGNYVYTIICTDPQEVTSRDSVTVNVK